MKNRLFLKSMTLLMLFTFVFESCLKDQVISDQSTANIEDQTVEYLKVVDDYIQKNGYDAEGVLKVINTYNKQKNGTEAIAFRELDNFLKKYRYLSKEVSLNRFFGLLHQDKAITDNELTELNSLDEKMSKNLSWDEGIKNNEQFREDDSK